MNTHTALVAAGLVLAAGVSATQPPPQHPSQDDSLEPRVVALEQELATLQQESAQLRALLDQTVGYLQSQAHASEAMLSVLDTSEEQGFTKGINFQSRETLLAGFRALWNEASKGVPASGEDEQAEGEQGADDAGRRRGGRTGGSTGGR